MNDRYLYRAKRIDNGEWVEGYLSHPHCTDSEKGVESYYFQERDENGWYSQRIVEASTICQCTGLRDKNGKLIYEENIVGDEYGSIGIVEFGVWNYYCRGFYIRWLSGNAKCYRNELGYWAPKVEIIGSAFDNLELLEVGG